MGCSFVGLLWVPVVGGLRGNASLPVPFAAAFLLARFGRPLGWRVRDATRREVPLRPLDLSRVDLLLSGTGVTPDGSAYSAFRHMASGRARPSLGAFVARQADRDLTRQVCHVFVLRQFDVAATVGGRLRRSDGFTLYASNRLAPDRGFGARPGVSDGVYGLLRPHDHGMPGVILDTGSEAFLLGERPPVHSPGWWLAAGISTFRAAGGMSMWG